MSKKIHKNILKIIKKTIDIHIYTCIIIVIDTNYLYNLTNESE
jgi:hypothetical protein